jgi:hypothetical protein
MKMSKQQKLRLEKLLASTYERALDVQSYRHDCFIDDVDGAKEAYENATKTVVGLEAIINELRKQET